jgi:hypothetical protein
VAQVLQWAWMVMVSVERGRYWRNSLVLGERSV